MFLKRIYQKDKNGALVMDSGNSVPNYKQIKKLQDTFEAMKVFMHPEQANTIELVLRQFKFNEEFISLCLERGYIVIDSAGEHKLGDSVYQGDTGLMKGDKPVVTQINVTQVSAKQNFTRKFIDKTLEEGFMSMVKGDIVLHTNPELTFKVVKVPGIYCCFTNNRLGDQKEARAYIKANYAGKKSPDINNPAGYRQDAFYACELTKTGETI